MFLPLDTLQKKKQTDGNADMNEDGSEEKAIMDTFLIWLKNTTECLTKTQEGLTKILKGKKS